MANLGAICAALFIVDGDMYLETSPLGYPKLNALFIGIKGEGGTPEGV
jgi:hypothetical protein